MAKLYGASREYLRGHHFINENAYFDEGRKTICYGLACPRERSGQGCLNCVGEVKFGDEIKTWKDFMEHIEIIQILGE